MALNLVTGYKGKDHVTAEQWSDFNRGIFGAAAILPVGNKMEVAIQTANQITVKDGVAVFDGRQVYIGYGESENISITSGTQSRKRYDIVVVKYTREEETGIENVAFQVVTGTPTSGTPADPTYQDTDIRTGVFTSQKPFCRVRLNGTAIEGIDMLVEVKEFKAHAFADPVNNTTGTDQSLPLAAPVGKKLQEQIDAQNSALMPVIIYAGTAKPLNSGQPWHSSLNFSDFAELEVVMYYEGRSIIQRFRPQGSEDVSHCFYFNACTANKDSKSVAGTLKFSGRYITSIAALLSTNNASYSAMDVSAITITRIAGYKS